MFKREAIVMLAFFLAIPVLGLLGSLLIPRIVSREAKKTYAAMTAAEFHCPDGTRYGTDRWGDAGYSRFCEDDGVLEGNWEAWEGGRKQISGPYSHGKKYGRWKIWNEASGRYDFMEYRDGAAIPPHPDALPTN